MAPKTPHDPDNDPVQFTGHDKKRLFATLDDVNTKQDKQSADIKELKLVVKGDESLGIPGLVKDMANVKKWIFKAMLYGSAIFGGWMTIGWIFDHAWTAHFGK